ncbi:MAG TPA: hypothetical protein VMR54_05795 [Thermoanaerobaculia bacterium]|nr:hypothetical protein [Thermoanaerobaculia bacterium]
MTLTAGTRLGPSEILAPIRAGGMGNRRSRWRRDLALATDARLGEPASTGRLIPSLRARSRGARLFPRLLRETPRAATGDLHR